MNDGLWTPSLSSRALAGISVRIFSRTLLLVRLELWDIGSQGLKPVESTDNSVVRLVQEADKVLRLE